MPDTCECMIEEVKKRKTVVKALCLHIAHDCNLACKYCFAEEGEYHGRRALMSYEVGKKALDFLIANSGSRRNLEVDFFGGEPLMNWQVVKDLVAYGREQEKIHNKHFRFTITTNGVLLNDEIQEFVNREMDNVVLSLDGRKEVNDRMRPFRNGAGSYDLIVPKFQKLADSRNQERYYVRGTFTGIILTFPRTSCISQILALSRCLWNRWWGRKRIPMPSGKRICQRSWMSTTNWLKYDSEGKGRKRFSFLPFYDRPGRRSLPGKTTFRMWIRYGISGSDALGRSLSLSSVCR